MIRLLFCLGCAAPMLWCQAEGRYHYASLTVKSGVAFQALVHSGTISVGKQAGARFTMEHPAAPGQALSLVASQSGSLLAGAPTAGAPELFVAMRAAEVGQPVTLAPGEWSAVMIAVAGGKPRGLSTAFIDFTVASSGANMNASLVAHQAAVDDMCRREAIVLQPGALEILGIKYELLMAAAGDMFLAVSTAPAHPSLLIALRRDPDVSTMWMRGVYALAEIGARNSFSFAPDQARFFGTMGTVEANGGQARVSQQVTLADSAVQFRGSAAYMVTAGGAGAFSPRLEQRRRNLAVGPDGSMFITAQVAEAGQLSLLHGVGVGIRVAEFPPPSLAPRATAQGNVVSLYGRNLEGTRVFIGGQPAAIVQAWPNQVNIKLATAPASPLTVELEWQRGRTSAVSVALAAAPPDFAAAPASPGGLIPPAQPGAPGDTIEIGITGAALPSGFAVLFDGVPGHVVSSALAGGSTQLKVTLPKSLTPSVQVNVALAVPGHYVDLGDIAVSRPRSVTPASH